MSKAALMTKPVDVTVGGTDFSFSPTVTDANNYSNGVLPGNKVEPARTYLERTVAPEQKADLIQLMNTVPGLVMELFGLVYEASKGDIKISLKN